MVRPLFRSVRARYGGVVITANRPMREFLWRLVEERLAAGSAAGPVGPEADPPPDPAVLRALATGLRCPAEPPTHALGG